MSGHRTTRARDRSDHARSDPPRPRLDHQPDRRQHQAHGVSAPTSTSTTISRSAWSAPKGELIAQCTGGMPPFVADSVGMAVRDGLADLRPRAAAPWRRRAVQSRRRARPASQQHGDVHADLCRAGARHADRLLRHQRALDRHRRHPDQLDRHLHGRAAAALDQAVVEGRADRGSLPHHREQHAHAARAAGRHRGAARRLPARTRSHRGSLPTNTASRPSARGRDAFSTSREAAARALNPRHAGRRSIATRPISTTTARRRRAGADQRQGDRRGRRADRRLHRHRRASRKAASIPAITAAARPSRASRSNI